VAGGVAARAVGAALIWADLIASANAVLGLKPPWNQPHERPAAFSSSPMFVPVSATASRVEQSSQNGCASLVSEYPLLPSGVRSASGDVEVAIDGLFAWCSGFVSTPPVSPDTRLIAPGADGPNVVSNELSLIE
jgi:hypothetical protein